MRVIDLQDWILDLPDTQALLDINTGRLYPKAQLFKRSQAMQTPPRFPAAIPSPQMSPIGSQKPGMQKPGIPQGVPFLPPPPLPFFTHHFPFTSGTPPHCFLSMQLTWKPYIC